MSVSESSMRLDIVCTITPLKDIVCAVATVVPESLYQFGDTGRVLPVKYSASYKSH
jgi:hypothetical protein